MAASRRRRIADRLHSVAIHVLRYAREADRETGLGPARLSALSVLVFGGPRTIGELADAEQVTPPTITRIVQGLEADGLVERRPSPGDARSYIVRATRKGEQVLARAREARLDRIESTLSSAGPGDLQLLSDALDRLVIP